MKFNSILLITFCLLQVLNCAKVRLSEQSLKNALIKTLKSPRINHQNTIKLDLPYEYTELNFTYSPLTSDNIQLYFDDFEEALYISFVNLNATVTGKHVAHFGYHKITTEFTAQLDDFKWEQVFAVSKKNLDITFTPTRESRVDVHVDRFTPKRENIPDEFIKDIGTSELDITDTLIKMKMTSLGYTEVKNQLRKVSQLILDTLQSDLK